MRGRHRAATKGGLQGSECPIPVGSRAAHPPETVAPLVSRQVPMGRGGEGAQALQREAVRLGSISHVQCAQQHEYSMTSFAGTQNCGRDVRLTNRLADGLGG